MSIASENKTNSTIKHFNISTFELFVNLAAKKH